MIYPVRTGIDMAANLSTADSINFNFDDYIVRIIDIEEEQRKAEIRELNERLEKLRNG